MEYLELPDRRRLLAAGPIAELTAATRAVVEKLP
jgi:hypothetical protein